MMWNYRDAELRREDMLREAEEYRRLRRLSPHPSHNYLMVARTYLARTLIKVGQVLVRRGGVPHEAPLRRQRT